MKRILLFTLLIGLFAVQASADMYTFDVPTAAGLRDVFWSDTQTPANNVLQWMGYKPGATADTIYDYDAVANGYGGSHPMYYAVGFTGDVTDNDGSGDGEAYVEIGAMDDAALLAAINADLAALSGGLTDFYLPISNDNNTHWSYKLYVDDSTNGRTETAWLPVGDLGDGDQITLHLTLTSAVTSVYDIGFGIRWKNTADSGDQFHTSIIPVPGAVLLGILGLSAAGIKLRRFA